MLDIIKNDGDVLRKTKLKLKDIKVLIELCLSKCYFLWENQFHELEDSGPIGLSLMVVMAEGFLQKIEKVAIEVALNRNPSVAPKTYKRYVDDSHSRFDSIENAENFKNILNQQNISKMKVC